MVRDYPEKFPPEIKAATIAANRFGYGLKSGYLQRIAEDGAKFWLIQQLKPQNMPDIFNDLSDSSAALNDLINIRQMSVTAIRKYNNDVMIKSRSEAAIHAMATLNSPDPFRERLIRFWCNHFTISIKRPRIAGVVAAFEREAIRPYIDGPFAKMLLAVARHPAMLIYLDNANSIGRHSAEGRRRRKRPNETYARKLLELHTLGVGLHYSKKDIRELANILTGWTLSKNKSDGKVGFAFNEEWHEPNTKTFMGRIFPESGVLEGEAAIDYLANHKITARHLATKMARHFISDNPSIKLINAMVEEFNKSQGHVMSLAKAMIDSKESWHDIPEKIKTPEDLVFSTLNALNIRPNNGKMIVRALEFLGQRPFAPSTSAGWPDTGSSWINADNIFNRLEWVASIAKDNNIDMKPTDQGLDILGSYMTNHIYNHMLIAKTPYEAIALMLMSPDFQRR